MACLTPKQIECFVWGELESDPFVACQSHFADCPLCREKLEAYQLQVRILDQLRQLPPDAFEGLGLVNSVSETVEVATATYSPTKSSSKKGQLSPETLSDELRSVPGYTLICQLSQGGQGVVYEATQHSTKRKVALKMLLPGTHASRAARQRFEREIEIIAQLKHPNIVAIYDAGWTSDQRHYFAMDFISGLPLNQYAQSKRLNMEQVLRLFVRVCDAIQYAHQRGVIHRDIKPSNVMVDADGTPKVLDFGLAKQLASTTDTISLPEQIIGTLPYMAPEQTRGNLDEIDTRTDVYALGVMLFELLTGQYPYPVDGELAEVLQHIVRTPPQRPSQVWSEAHGVSRSLVRFHPRCPIDNDLETIVLRALAKESVRRYQSAGELASDIERYMRGDPIEAKRDSTFYVMCKLARRHRGTSLIMILLIVILIGTGWISAFSYRHAWLQDSEHQKTAKKLESTQGRLSQVLESDVLSSLRNEVLPWFLMEWRAGQLDRARAIQEMVKPQSPQYLAMEFLLADQPDFAGLLTEMPEGHKGLAFFVIAESCWRVQDEARAMEYYEHCVASDTPTMLKDAASARLECLISKRQSPTRSSRGEGLRKAR
jgi:serine/threonine protein kinase